MPSETGPVVAAEAANATQLFEESGAAVLLSEIHHRVMNSFQVISALATRFGRVKEIGDLPPILDDLESRLFAFAAVHRQLAMPPSGCFERHCLSLSENLVAAFGRSDAVRLEADGVDLPAGFLTKASLIVAELVTNSLKHSLYRLERGSIDIELRARRDHFLIEARDSAAASVPPVPPDASRIVCALASSMGGTARVIDRDGYCVRVILPIDAERDGALVHELRGGPSSTFRSVPSGRPQTAGRSVSDVRL